MLYILPDDNAECVASLLTIPHCPRSTWVKEAADTLLAKTSLREPSVQPDFSHKGDGHYLSKTLDNFRRNTTNFLHIRRHFAFSLPLPDRMNSPSSFIQQRLILNWPWVTKHATSHSISLIKSTSYYSTSTKKLHLIHNLLKYLSYCRWILAIVYYDNFSLCNPRAEDIDNSVGLLKCADMVPIKPALNYSLLVLLHLFVQTFCCLIL